MIRAGAPLAVWQSAVLERIETRVQSWSRNVSVRAQAGGWMHDAVCQEHWNALGYDVDSPHAQGSYRPDF